MTVNIETYAAGVKIGTETVNLPPEVANRRTIEQAAADALEQNRTIVTGGDTYLAGHITLPASPTTAQTVAAVKAYGVQVRALTFAAQWAAEQRNGLIRLVLDRLESTE